MTLIASWVSADDKRKGKKLSALYFCSDSRFSWRGTGATLQDVFDEGQKVFGSTNSPEIFCYCGDVQFPIYTIQPLINEIDKGLFFKPESGFAEKTSQLFGYFEQKLKDYPTDVLAHPFKIYYATCISYRFYCAKFDYDKQRLAIEAIPLPNESTLVFYDGSGSSQFHDRWIERDNAKMNEHKTSRNVYRCMAEAIATGEDKMTGGSPQLIGIYRNGHVQPYGIIKDDNRYFQGRILSDSDQLDNIEWRNDNFERVNPHTMQLLSGAQPQPFAQ